MKKQHEDNRCATATRRFLSTCTQLFLCVINEKEISSQVVFGFFSLMLVSFFLNFSRMQSIVLQFPMWALKAYQLKDFLSHSKRKYAIDVECVPLPMKHSKCCLAHGMLEECGISAHRWNLMASNNSNTFKSASLKKKKHEFN